MRHLLTLLLIALSLPLTPVAGAETGAGFTLSSAVPDSAATGYVRLSLPPATTRTLAMTLRNLSDVPANFDLQLVDAGTGSDGRITYIPGTPHPKAGARLSQFATLATSALTVPAHASTPVTVTVRVPATGLPGDLLGAVHVTRRPTTQASGGLQNRFAMAVPIHLSGPEPPATKPRLTLTKAALTAQATGLMVTAHLTNHTPRTFGRITLTSSVHRANGTRLMQQRLTDAEMAPTSTMPLQLPLTHRQLAPGRYTVRVTLTSGTTHYQLTDHFTVRATTRTIAPNAAAHRPSGWMWLSAGLVALILLLVGLLYRQRQKGART